MNVLITGGRGQLGRALQSALSAHDLTIADLPEVDVSDKTAVFSAVAQAQPNVVIHCAAYTNVDGCAEDPALAYKINALGTQNVALACLEHDAELIHISTNEVFPGTEPDGYTEWMPLDPINPYGASKAAAEAHVRHILNRSYIVRTAWLYAPGGRNFIHRILNAARKGGPLQVVDDEFGNPTYVKDLARAIGQLLGSGQYGTYHLVNEGICSRWAFANEILRQAGLDSVGNTPISSDQFNRLSTPPKQAALQNVAGKAIGIRLRPWQDALADYMAENVVREQVK